MTAAATPPAADVTGIPAPPPPAPRPPRLPALGWGWLAPLLLAAIQLADTPVRTLTIAGRAATWDPVLTAARLLAAVLLLWAAQRLHAVLAALRWDPYPRRPSAVVLGHLVPVWTVAWAGIWTHRMSRWLRERQGGRVWPPPAVAALAVAGLLLLWPWPAVGAAVLLVVLADLRRGVRRHLRAHGLLRDDRPRWGRRLLVGAGAVLAAGAVAAVLLTVGMEQGYLPDTAAVPGHALPARQRAQMVELGLLDADEQVIYFYSDGAFSLREDGNLCTDRRVVSWLESDGEIYVEEAVYAEIDSLAFHPGGGSYANSVIEVILADGGVFNLLAADEDGGDERFFRALEHAWRRACPGAAPSSVRR